MASGSFDFAPLLTARIAAAGGEVDGLSANTISPAATTTPTSFRSIA